MRRVMMGVGMVMVVWGSAAPSPVMAAQSPTADFGQLLVNACNTVPAPPVIDRVSHELAEPLVAAYARKIDDYQSCLHLAARRRGDLSAAEQTLLAGHLNRAANLLRRLRLDYGDAIRGIRDADGAQEPHTLPVTG